MFYRYSIATTSPWVMVIYEGPDLSDFLERLTTVSIRSLPPGQGRPGCFLNAQGRIISTFFLWRFTETKFGFEIESTPRAIGDLDQWIEQYRFSERFTRSETLSASGIILSDDGFSDLSALHFQHEQIFHHGDLIFGKPWITSYGKSWEKWTSPENLQWGDTKDIEESEVESWRIKNLGARSGHEITSEVSPLELGMVFWVARGKGCYPGQEVIERTFTYGSPSQRLVELEFFGAAPSLSDLPCPIHNLADSPVEIGRITSVSGSRGLGIIKKIHAKTDLPFQIKTGTTAIKGRVLRVASFEEKS